MRWKESQIIGEIDRTQRQTEFLMSKYLYVFRLYHPSIPLTPPLPHLLLHFLWLHIYLPCPLLSFFLSFFFHFFFFNFSFWFSMIESWKSILISVLFHNLCRLDYELDTRMVWNYIDQNKCHHYCTIGIISTEQKEFSQPPYILPSGLPLSISPFIFYPPPSIFTSFSFILCCLYLCLFYFLTAAPVSDQKNMQFWTGVRVWI